MLRRRMLAGAIVACTLFCGGRSFAAPPPDQLYVSPAGSDGASGSASTPLRTIQAALDRAVAGTTVHLAPGVYREQVVTRRDGTPARPIRVVGPETGPAASGRYRAVLLSGGRALSVNHSSYVFSGFTVDGQPGLPRTQYPAAPDPAAVIAFKRARHAVVQDGRLVYVGAADTARGVHNVILDDLWLTGAGGECVHVRNASRYVEIRRSTIQWCGLAAKPTTDYPFHNGEGVYVGTSPKSSSAPMHANDTTSDVWVHDNVIRTFGSECFDVKENAHDNTFERNRCSFNQEPLSVYGSAVELRGSRNRLSGNEITDSLGWGVKISADSPRYDNSGNVVAGNRMGRLTGPALAVKTQQRQGVACGNTLAVPGAARARSLDQACVSATQTQRVR